MNGTALLAYTIPALIVPWPFAELVPPAEADINFYRPQEYGEAW